MTDLSALIARVEAATGPDREIDWEVHCLGGMEGAGSYGRHPAYTASVDAVLALIERKLPDEAWLLLDRVLYSRKIEVFDTTQQKLALALLAATLRALNEATP